MENTKKCPFCGEEILLTAVKCRYCNEWLNESKSYTTIKVIIISILFYLSISLFFSFVVNPFTEGDLPPIKNIAEGVFNSSLIGLLMGIAISRTISTSSDSKNIKLGAVYGAGVNLFLQIVYFRAYLLAAIFMMTVFAIAGAINAFVVVMIIRRKHRTISGDKKNEA